MKRVTEGKWTADLLAMLRENLGPRFTVLKHSDRFTTSIPDFSVSNSTGKTLWFEVKILHEEGEITSWAASRLAIPKLFVDKPAQLHLTKKLGGWYVVHNPFENITMLAAAKDVDLNRNSICQRWTGPAWRFRPWFETWLIEHLREQL